MVTRGFGRLIKGRRNFWNINGQNCGDVNYLIALAKKNQPILVVVMDNLWLAVEIQKVLPNGIVIHRSYFTSNTRYWQDRTAAQTHNHIVQIAEPFYQSEDALTRWAIAQIFFLHNNEPNTDDPTREGFDSEWLDECLDWHFELNDLNGTRYRDATGFATTKSLDRDRILSGDLDRHGAEFDKRRGRTLFGVTSYTYACAQAYFMPGYPDNLFDKVALQRINWPKRHEIDWEGKNGYPDLWHIGKEALCNIRWMKAGIITEPIPIAVIETVNDEIESTRWVASENKPLHHAFENRYNGGNKVRGYHTLAGFYNEIWGVSVERGYAEQAMFLDDILPDYFMLAHFTKNKNRDWWDFDGTDHHYIDQVFGDTPIRTLGAPANEEDTKIPTEPPMPTSQLFPPYPSDKWVAKTIKPTEDYFRLRSEPNNISALIEIREPIQVEMNMDDAIPDGATYKWVPMVWQQTPNKLVKVWAYDEWFEDVEDDVTEPPVDPPVVVDPPTEPPVDDTLWVIDIPPPSVALTDSDKEKLALWFDLMASQMRVWDAESVFVDTVDAIAKSVRGKRPMPVVAGVTEGLDDSEEQAVA